MTIAAINRYDATTALKKIASGTFTATDYLKACLDRIAEREEDVGAFTHLAAQRALVQASDTDARPLSGALHGIPIAIKDIIDTHDMPTEHGSPIYKGSIPVSDAACVAMHRRDRPRQDRHTGVCRGDAWSHRQSASSQAHARRLFVGIGRCRR